MEIPSLHQAVAPDERRRGSGRAAVEGYLPLALLVALAATTRFLFLDHQSLWYDEIVSLTLVKQPFAAMLHDLARTESTPPLYYIVLWLWVRVFGTTTDALRSLSAVFGVLTVAVLYSAARLRFSPGAALIAGALAATNPMLIWYSQETRAYALVTFFLACSLYFMLRARPRGAVALTGWSVTACLALASHYFAVFALLPEAAYLLYIYRHRPRPVLLALVAPTAVEAALLPLALHQRSSGHTAYIAAVPLTRRIEDTLDAYLLGPYGTSGLHALALCLLVGAVLMIGVARSASAAAKGNALLLASIGLITFILPLLAVPGSFRDKNLIVALPPLLLAAGAALVPRPRGAIGLAAGLTAAAIFLLPTVLAARRLDLQREDWRGIARLIGPARPTRAVLTYPQWEYIALTHYRRDLRPVTRGILHVRELVLVGRTQLDTLRIPAGFKRVQDRHLGKLRLIRLHAKTTRTLKVASLHLHPLLHLLHQSHSLAHAPGQDATLLVERTADP